MAVARARAAARQVIAVAAVLMAVVVARAGDAEAATLLSRALPLAGLKTEGALKPTLVRRKGKARRKKGMRRKAHKRKRHAKKNHGKKPKGKKPSGKKPKNSKNQTSKNVTPDNKPAKNPDKSTTKTPDNKPGNKPGKQAANPVCIGGRVKSGRCRCRRAGARRQIRKSVFACARGGKPVVLPSTANGAAGQPANPAQNRTGRDEARLPRFVPNEVLVTVRQATGENVDAAVARRHGLKIAGRSRLGTLGARLVRFLIPDGRPVADVVAALKRDRRVSAPQPNYYYRRQGEVATFKAASLQYALAKVDVPSAHALARGRGVRIAIIDSGVDGSHPDLAGAVEATFDASRGKAARAGDHATAVAGIIRARGLMQGVAPGAKLLCVRVFAKAGKKKTTAATTASLLRGIDWALGRKARVLNMSLAGPHDPLLEQGIAVAHRKRAIIVAAAGNGGSKASPAYPAAYDNVIAVTATDVADRLYASANRGGYITIAAPGVDILAPALGNGHALRSGTSFAAAHISGIIALMLERDSRLTASQARRALMAAARDLGRPGHDGKFGAGRVDAFKALARISVRKASR